MSEFEEIQKLIRLKRHERPSPDFVEEFLTSFRERQRAEMLQHSARSLLWERVSTYFSEMLNPKWAWATATTMAVATLGGLWLLPHEGGPQVAQSKALAAEPAEAEVAINDPNAFKADVESYLHAIESEANGNPGSRLIGPNKFIQPPQGSMLPAGLRFDTPSLPQR